MRRIVLRVGVLSIALGCAGCLRWNVGFDPGGGAPAIADGGVSDQGGAGQSGALDGGATDASGGSKGGAVDGGPAPWCYSEPMSLNAPIADLEQAFVAGPNGNWLATTLGILMRRIPGGFTLLDAQKSDSQLPNFVDSASWQGVALNFSSMCNAETTGWDYAHATATQFAYFMPPAQTVTPPSLTTFACSEVAAQLTDATTQRFDATYLEQQSCDLLTLADELDAFTNGLACQLAVGHEVSGLDARDGVAAFLYYLELYLRTARASHPDVYAMLKSSPDWQRLVRYEWARGNFWFSVAQGFPGVGSADGPIWAHVRAPANLAELALYTGESADQVACTP